MQFVLVQIQSASPPTEVVMPSRTAWWPNSFRNRPQPKPSQQHTLADSQFYTAQKQADGDAYQITKLAEAQARGPADDPGRSWKEKGILAEQYIQVLIAQELSQNSKWVISDGETMPIIDFGGTTTGQGTTP